MSRFDNSELPEIMESIDFESWLDREGISYKTVMGKSGVQANVQTCPVCGNDHWKTYVNMETGLGNCFVCDKKFSKWSFIAAFSGLSKGCDIFEHVKLIAREQGWRPHRVRTAASTNLAVDDLVLPESLSIPIEGRNLSYLENRNITSTVARYFGLRYSHRGKYHFCGVDGRDRSQDYSKRIIIPIFDLFGNLVGFQGRDITGTAEKKYLFPSGVASSGAHLYNGQNAHGATDIVVGEGVFDVMALHVAFAGDRDLRDVVPVGTFGKHLSSGSEASQLAKFMTLKEGALRRVTLMWDSEKAALGDAVDACLLLRSCGLVARLAILPPGRDPNEVAASVVREAYWKAQIIDLSTAARLKVQISMM